MPGGGRKGGCGTQEKDRPAEGEKGLAIPAHQALDEPPHQDKECEPHYREGRAFNERRKTGAHVFKGQGTNEKTIERLLTRKIMALF